VSSHLTHQAPLCKQGCQAVAAAIAAALHARVTLADTAPAIPVVSLAEAVLSALPEPYASLLNSMLRCSPPPAASNGPDADEGWHAALKVLHEMHPAPPEFLVNSPFQPPSITMYPPHTAGWAIYCAVRAADLAGGFWEAVFIAIAPGGDTDTVAACAGAIAGAWFGLSALVAERPRQAAAFLAKLHDQDEDIVNHEQVIG
jgi:ADP-ribosylglycohydrolase